MTINSAARYREHWSKLGISESHISERGLRIFEGPEELRVAETSPDGREYCLTPAAAEAWQEMKAAAADDSVHIYLLSAFRSVERQVEIIQQKLEAGQAIEHILTVIAPPGCSEHHTGRAVDIGTGQSVPLEVEFESTPAFSWLDRHASRFGFSLSFPEGNEWGYAYEPWHWCYE